MAIKVKGIKKLKADKKAMSDFIEDSASEMRRLVRHFAPRDTGTLKNHGVDAVYIENGVKVFLDTDEIKNNYPDERQQKRADGGNYGYYQEVGWTQHGVHHPGRFYWDQAYDVTEYRMDALLKYKYLDEIVTLK